MGFAGDGVDDQIGKKGNDAVLVAAGAALGLKAGGIAEGLEITGLKGGHIFPEQEIVAAPPLDQHSFFFTVAEEVVLDAFLI